MSAQANLVRTLRGKLLFAKLITGHFGWWKGLRVLCQWKLGRGLFRLTPPQSATPMLLRPRTSDLPMFSQTFIEQQYAFDLEKEPMTIIDAGANIGTASCYFAARFPKAKILALEPDPSNYGMLCRNVAHLSQVIPLQTALWWKPGTLHLVTAGRHKSQVEVREPDAQPGNAEVEAVTMGDLIARHGLTFIDLLKIDIEGAEKSLFEKADGWIDRVAVIAVELHETIAPGSTNVFNKATNAFPSRRIWGENLIVSRDE
jgi:FkbM family methyltransferase